MSTTRRALLICWTACLAWSPALGAQDRQAPTENPDASTYIRPPEPIERMLRTDKSYATLSYLGPDGDHFLVARSTDLSSLELMSRETYRLGELEVRPSTDRLWHLDTYGVHGFRFYSLATRSFVEADLPEGAFASDFTWSGDGSQVAFLAHLPSHTEAWAADATTGATRSLSDARVLATLGTSAAGQGTRPSTMLQWTPDGTVITLVVPEGRGAEPARNRVPVGPLTRRTRDEPTSTRTFPYLLADAHDEMLFERYTRAQITELGAAGGPRALGEPGMYESLSLSPDGRYLLATRIERPFSFRTSYRGFPRATVVLDRSGAEVAALRHQSLREAGGGEDRDEGPRDFAWLPDGSGLGYVESDRLMRATPPFDLDDAEVLAESDHPVGSAWYSLDGRHAFATVSRNGESGLAYWALGGSSLERALLVDFHETDDPTELPGDLLTQRTANGLAYALVSSDGRWAYLDGDGFKADFRHRPFIDRVSLEDGSATRLFEGARDTFDQPLVPLDPGVERLIVSRESVTDFPDSYLWEGGEWQRLTDNVDPFPEVTAATRIDFDFERRDGLTVHGRVSLPVGYVEGQEVPAIFWTYPREFEEPKGYEHDAIRRRNRNAFTHMSWLRWSDLWLTQGYALVHPDIPIVGENFNDTYIGNLVDAMYGAIRAVDGLGVIDVDRIGHGGHSYGAFATANVLANAPFFKAGIAGDGAYNRSLTPNGFQNEPRSLWEAPQTYIEMSPFFKADQIDTPLLMYHGGDDNNTGTFPVQSRRMIDALTAFGKTAVLYEYPYESHTPRAIENKLDMWARFVDWFDRYVKASDRPVSQD